MTREEAPRSPASGPDPLTDTKSHGFVRAARASDAADLARVQVASWCSAYAGIVPQDVLAELTSAEAEALWRDRWHEAITKPPTSRHRVLVAVEESAPESANERTVAGFAAAGPAMDKDRWPATDAELYELRVPPEMTGHGHGSRLLNAVADTLADDGFATLSTWVLETDGGLQRALEDVGWAADGARRELDMGVPGTGGPVPLIRLHTTISQ